MSINPASNNPISLRKLYDTLEARLRSLDALGQDTDQQLFVTLITSKLPKHTMTQLELLRLDGQDWSATTLRQKLGTYIAAQESADRLCASESGSQIPSSNTEQEQNHLTLLSSESSNGPRRKRSCVFCSEDHFSDQCKKFVSVSERKRASGARGRCFRCLKKGHPASRCEHQKKCF